MRESVEQFRLRADQAPVLIWTARPDTTLDYLNGFCVQLTGRPLEELREKGWLDYVHPEDVDRCLATYVPAFEARRPFLLEYRLRHADGEYRWFLASGVPKYGRDGSFTGYVGCDIDITERKNAEDRIRASQAALEASHQEIQFLAGRLIEGEGMRRPRMVRILVTVLAVCSTTVSRARSSLCATANSRRRRGSEAMHETFHSRLVARGDVGTCVHE